MRILKIHVTFRPLNPRFACRNALVLPNYVAIIEIHTHHCLMVHCIGPVITSSTAPYLRAPLTHTDVAYSSTAPGSEPFESEWKFHHPEYMFDSSTGSGLHTVARPLQFRQWMAPRCFFFLSTQRLFNHCFTMARMRLIAPHLDFVTMLTHPTSGCHAHWRHSPPPNESTLSRCPPHVRFHSEIPLFAFARRVHVRIATMILVLDRTRHIHDSRIDSRVSLDFAPLLNQIALDPLKNLLCHYVFLQQMVKPADRGFVHHPLRAQVNSGKLAHHLHVVQRFFYRQVPKIIPMLQKIESQHLLHTNRPPHRSRGLRIIGLNQLYQRRPCNDLVHVIQNLCHVRFH